MDQNRWDNVESTAPYDIDDSENIRNFNQPSEYQFNAKKCYIPRRSFEKYLTPRLLVPAVVVSVILVVLAILLFRDGGSDASDGGTAGGLARKLSQGLVVQENDALWHFDPTTNESELLHSLHRAPLAAYAFLDGDILWIEANSTTLYSAAINGGNPAVDPTQPEAIFQEKRVSPNAVAVDRYTRKLYVLDESLGVLFVVDRVTKQYTILKSDLKEPREIHLDSAQGFMFILQSKSIARANMDGTALRNIVSYLNINTMAIDQKSERIYWVNDLFTIQSSDYHGNRLALFTDHVRVSSLAAYEGRLYWLWPAAESNNSTLWSCEIQNQTCSNHTLVPSSLPQNVVSIRTFSDWTVPARKNPCEVNNGGCQQMCLLSSKEHAGRSCTCYLGWQLNEDPRSCRRVRDFMLYTSGNLVRGQVMEESRFAATDVIIPTKFYNKSLSRKNVVDFDYDLARDELYFSDDLHIYRMSLINYEAQTVVLSSTGSNHLEDLAVDWLSRNLYYSVYSDSSSGKHSLMLLGLTGPSGGVQKTIKTFSSDWLFGMQGCPYSTAAHPRRGLLFFSAKDGDSRSIYKTTLNGTRLRMSASKISFVHEFRLLALDYEQERLYWIRETSGSETSVAYIGLDAPPYAYAKIIYVQSVKEAKSLSVHKQWLYISTLTAIWRVHKETGEDATMLVPRFAGDVEQQISGVRIVSPDVQSTSDDDNGCAVDNGGCEQICFAKPKRACDCMDNLSVQQDGRCA